MPRQKRSAAAEAADRKCRGTRLQRLVAGAGNDVELLLPREVDELDGVAGHADGEVGVLLFFGVFHGVDEFLGAKDVDVEVVRALVKVAVHDLDEVLDPFLLAVAQRAGVDGLRVGDAVQRPVVGQLGERVERRQQAVGLGPVAGVGARGKRRVGFAAVGHGAGGLAVDDVGGDGQDRGRRLGVAVGVAALDLLKEAAQQGDGDVVGAVVVVAVFGEIALDLIVGDKALLVADALDLGVLDGREAVHHVAEPGDAGGEGAAHVGVDEGHLGGLVVVFVVHILDEVEDVDIQPGQPVQHDVVLLHDLVVVEVFRGDGRVVGADLLAEFFVDAAVDGVQQALGQVGARQQQME